jgi:hypothetical protein
MEHLRLEVLDHGEDTVLLALEAFQARLELALLPEEQIGGGALPSANVCRNPLISVS